MTEMNYGEQNRILDRKQIQQKIKRIAFEIYENNFEESELLLAGIHENGYLVAQLIARELKSISPIDIHLAGISLNKHNPLDHPIEVEPSDLELNNRVIILVDDVLNTGKTLAHSLQSFLKSKVKKVETATLINRHNTLFPISATYTGISLSTTLQEHIRVVLTDNDQFGAYLI